jgi:hypothetical protein
LLEQSLIASLKQSVGRQLPAKPPISAIQLSLNGEVLEDDMLVDEIIDNDDDKEEDEETEGSEGLVLQLDMVPPVDPKFVSDLEGKLPDLTTSELLAAYCLNEAALYHNAALLVEPTTSTGDDDDTDDEEEGMIGTKSSLSSSSASFQIRERASQIQRDLETQLLKSEQTKELLADTQPPSAKQQASQPSDEVRGERVRHNAATGVTGGVKSSLKRKIQRKLNVDWPVTIRHFCLFLFFGWFGGRTPDSRAILLLRAPSVFVLQARSVKLLLKQLLYTLFDHPPGILLSLLPAPQQAILSLNVPKAMNTMYGDIYHNGRSKASSPPTQSNLSLTSD